MQVSILGGPEAGAMICIADFHGERPYDVLGYRRMQDGRCTVNACPGFAHSTPAHQAHLSPHAGRMHSRLCMRARAHTHTHTHTHTLTHAHTRAHTHRHACLLMCSGGNPQPHAALGSNGAKTPRPALHSRSMSSFRESFREPSAAALRAVASFGGEGRGGIDGGAARRRCFRGGVAGTPAGWWPALRVHPHMCPCALHYSFGGELQLWRCIVALQVHPHICPCALHLHMQHGNARTRACIGSWVPTRMCAQRTWGCWCLNFVPSLPIAYKSRHGLYAHTQARTCVHMCTHGHSQACMQACIHEQCSLSMHVRASYRVPWAQIWADNHACMHVHALVLDVATARRLKCKPTSVHARMCTRVGPPVPTLCRGWCRHAHTRTCKKNTRAHAHMCVHAHIHELVRVRTPYPVCPHVCTGPGASSRGGRAQGARASLPPPSFVQAMAGSNQPQDTAFPLTAATRAAQARHAAQVGCSGSRALVQKQGAAQACMHVALLPARCYEAWAASRAQSCSHLRLR